MIPHFLVIGGYMAKSKSLTRNDFLSGNATKPVEKELASMGGSVYFRKLSAQDGIEFNKLVEEAKGMGNDISEGTASVSLGMKLVLMTVCDETGTLLFTADDTDKLLELPMEAVQELLTLSMEVAGMGKKAEAKNTLKNAESVS